jgi:DNA transformation protein and related proteins
MSDLSAMPNIGGVLAQKMLEVDIYSAKALVEMGSKEAFLRVKTVYPDACINHLYALEGAIKNIRWHHLSPETKTELKIFFDSVK